MANYNDSLSPEQALKNFRKHRNNIGIRRGTIKKVSLSKSNNEVSVIGMAALILIGFSLLSALLANVFLGIHGLMSVVFGISIGAALTCVYIGLPILHIALHIIFTFRLPPKSTLKKYSFPHLVISIIAISLLILVIPIEAEGGFSILNTQKELIGILCLWAAIVIGISIGLSSLPSDDDSTPLVDKTKENDSRDVFNLYIGESTGELIKRSHKPGIEADQNVKLSQFDAALNILILGGIGEGKTTTLINPLLLQLMDQKCGGLILDVKGSFKKTVATISQVTKTPVTVVGVGRQKINLIAGLSPDLAANMMGALFFMTNGNKESQFWIIQATLLCRAAFGFLKYFPKHYTLAGLNSFLFTPEFREEIEAKLMQLELSDQERRVLQGFKENIKMFDAARDTMQSDIKSSATNALSYFTNPDFIDSFCYVGEDEEELKIEEVLDGRIFLLDLPISKYVIGARIVMALIKMRWFHTMESRRVHDDWDQDRMVFFMCDEYQNVVTVDPQGNSVNDLNFWDKSRDTKAIGIISSQSITSFYSAIGQHDYANTVLQNFRQRFYFKTEDGETLKQLQTLTGEVEVGKITKSKQKGNSTGQKSHSSNSTSESLSYVRQPVVDTQFMRSLEPNQAIALLTIDQQSMDDVLQLRPIYLS